MLLTTMVRLHSSPPFSHNTPTHTTQLLMMKYYLDVNFTVHFRERKTMQITPCCLPSDRATLHLTLQKHIHMLEGHSLICFSDFYLGPFDIRIAFQHYHAPVSSYSCAKKIILEQWLGSLDGRKAYGRIYPFDSCDCVSHVYHTAAPIAKSRKVGLPIHAKYFALAPSSSCDRCNIPCGLSQWVSNVAPIKLPV